MECCTSVHLEIDWDIDDWNNGSKIIVDIGDGYFDWKGEEEEEEDDDDEVEDDDNGVGGNDNCSWILNGLISTGSDFEWVEKYCEVFFLIWLSLLLLLDLSSYSSFLSIYLLSS